MARRSRMTILKRQREQKQSEKAARKRAKRHGRKLEIPLEPMPTAGAAEFFGRPPDENDDQQAPAEHDQDAGPDLNDTDPR